MRLPPCTSTNKSAVLVVLIGHYIQIQDFVSLPLRHRISTDMSGSVFLLDSGRSSTLYHHSVYEKQNEAPSLRHTKTSLHAFRICPIRGRTDRAA